MSALPLKADMCGAKTNVRFGPIADLSCVLWHDVRMAAMNGERHPGVKVNMIALAGSSQLTTGFERPRGVIFRLCVVCMRQTSRLQ
jgi:hypothetical protein